jgi:transcriptional regulator with XRE-family HTH domain
MPGDESPAYVPLARLRERLALRIEETSLRQVARELGMSPSGLQKVLEGGQPYGKTTRKLAGWYIRDQSRYGGTVTAAAAAAALNVLLQDLPPARRHAGQRRLVELLGELHDRPPDWLAELRASLRDPPRTERNP